MILGKYCALKIVFIGYFPHTYVLLMSIKGVHVPMLQSLYLKDPKYLTATSHFVQWLEKDTKGEEAETARKMRQPKTANLAGIAGLSCIKYSRGNNNRDANTNARHCSVLAGRKEVAEPTGAKWRGGAGRGWVRTTQWGPWTISQVNVSELPFQRVLSEWRP